MSKLNGWYVVKPWSLMEEEYGLTPSGNINTDWVWTGDMEKICPKGRVIEVIDLNWNGFTISEYTLLGPYFEYGEEVEVRDFDEEKWVKDFFYNYEFGRDNICSIKCKRQNWKQVRKLEPKPKQKVTLELTDEQLEKIKDIIGEKE